MLPPLHVFANTCVMNRTVAQGGMIVLLPRFDGGQVLAAIQRARADRVVIRLTPPKTLVGTLGRKELVAEVAAGG